MSLVALNFLLNIRNGNLQLFDSALHLSSFRLHLASLVVKPRLHSVQLVDLLTKALRFIPESLKRWTFSFTLCHKSGLLFLQAQVFFHHLLLRIKQILSMHTQIIVAGKL